MEFTDMIFVGTSGMSATVGGLGPNEGCQPVSTKADAQRIANGSLCVTSTAFDLTCGKCVSDARVQPNECSRPNCDDHTSTAMFGECSYSGSVSLQEELVAAAERIALPPPNCNDVGSVVGS